jgi:inner membrane protein
MASLGHVAIGMAAGRLQSPSSHALLGSMVFWSFLSMLPDADVIGLSFGIPYDHPWGHRGATHSFAFAASAGVAVGVGGAMLGVSALRPAVTAALVVASHPVLDVLTDGGLGCALFWPFDDTRYFAPWNPIPVAPIGVGFLSSRGVRVAATELIMFAPVFAIALWPRGSLQFRR